MMNLKLKAYSILPQALQTQAILWKMPKSYIIEVTNICNQRCAMCPWYSLMKRKTEMMSYDRFALIFEKIKDHAEAISFYLMGEPFLNTEIFKMITLCKKHGVRTHISSNGMLVGAVIDKILDSGLDSLQITLDGFSAESHEKYRVGSNFEIVKEGIRKIAEERKKRGSAFPTLTIQTLIFKFNEKEIPEIEKFARECGIDHFSLKAPNMGRDVSVKESFVNDFLLESEEYKKFNRTADMAGDKYYKNKNFCPQFSNGVIAVSGDVVPCCFDYDAEVKFGNIFEENLETVWRSDKRKKFVENYLKKTNPLCVKCDFIEEWGKKIF